MRHGRRPDADGPCRDRLVDQMAARLERSRGWIMKQALSAWLDQEEYSGRLREAMGPSRPATTRAGAPQRKLASMYLLWYT